MKYLKKYKINLDSLPKILFILSIGIVVFFYGFATHQYRIFPYSLFKEANEGFNLILAFIKGDKDEELYRKTNYTKIIPTYDKNAAYNGLSLLTLVAANESLAAKIVDMDGTLIHEWNIDWYKIWTDVTTHIPQAELPKSRPGTHIHGAVLLDNGDLVFNFEGHGTVRLDLCGKVVWQLPYRTHHSIYRDEYNNLWISAQKDHLKTPMLDFPNYKPPIIEMMILKVSEEGKILDEISIMDLLKENGLQGFLFMSSKAKSSNEVFAGHLHLNDVETFPSFKKEGFFKAGDIMVSLRNINTILIFRNIDGKLKYLSMVVGEFVGQHDPDFIDGNTISIFDNNDIAPDGYGLQSRILIKSFIDNQIHVYYTGTKEKPFFTEVMGKHQWLLNGNLLITEATKGRAFEIDKKGNIVWEYINLVEKGYIGMLEEAQRLPSKYTKEFFEQNTQRCHNSNLN